jgi:hypothetical protein
MPLVLGGSRRSVPSAQCPSGRPGRWIGAFLLAAALLPDAQGAVTVSGSVGANTTWYTGTGPCLLSGAVVVSPGVTLKIELGVVVRGIGGRSIPQVDGMLVVDRTSG